jgi:hypothetical protein
MFEGALPYINVMTAVTGETAGLLVDDRSRLLLATAMGNSYRKNPKRNGMRWCLMPPLPTSTQRPQV